MSSSNTYRVRFLDKKRGPIFETHPNNEQAYKAAKHAKAHQAISPVIIDLMMGSDPACTFAFNGNRFC